jgi:hypothetical protein
MSSSFTTPLLDLFRRGEVPPEVRLLAAHGAIAPRAYEQLALLMLLVHDTHVEIRLAAEETLSRLPQEPLAAFLARSDVPGDVREFFHERGVEPAPMASDDAEQPLLDGEAKADEGAGDSGRAPNIANMNVMDRVKLAMRGRREDRAALIRDPNRLVAAAVLSSPKLTGTEIEAFARMGNVSEEVLRIIGTNRAWIKKYPVTAALARNPKTPLAVSMPLLQHLVERDVKQIATDRTAQEPVRVLARKILATGQARKR